MKNILAIIGIIIIHSNLFCQKDSNRIFFNEFIISANRTNLKDGNTSDRFGYGAGIYRVGKKSKTFNLLFGFEFNKTQQFKDYVYDGHYGHLTNVTFDLYNFSIPIGYRFNFGNKIKFFIQQDFFADFVQTSKMQGTYHSYYPGQPPAEHKVKGDSQLNGSNYGVSLGLGLRIPIMKYELLIKPDYKLGLSNLSQSMTPFYNIYYRLLIGIRIGG